MSIYKSSEKLWKIIAEPNGYFYELRAKGVVLERIRIDDKKLPLLKEYGVM